MLTNPSPNARIPWAVSRSRRLRRSRPGLLIGGAGAMHVSQLLHSTRGARKRDFPEIGFGRARFRPCDRAAIWRSYYCAARARAAGSGVPYSRMRPADSLDRPTIARTTIDRSAVDVSGGRKLTNAIR